MKNKNGLVWMSLEDEMGLIEKVLMDNGDWEYNRLGVGVDSDKKLFLVDLDDSGEEWRVVNYVKDGLSMEEVLEEGVKCGVFEKIDWGYDENDDYRVENDCSMDLWDEFSKKVLEKEVFECELYSFV